MTRIVFAVAIVACLGVVVIADEPTALPKDVPPIVGTALATKGTGSEKDKWSIELTVSKVRWEVVGEKRPKLDWPRFKVTAEGSSLTLPMVYGPATALAEPVQNRILDLKGKKLSPEEALKRFASKQAVLVSVSGQMPDAYYLQTTKPDTLIVVLGIPSAPAPDLLPQAASLSKHD